MDTEFHIWYGIKGAEKDKSRKELKLWAFDGRCYKCREIGHKANNCPKKDASNRDIYEENVRGNNYSENQNNNPYRVQKFNGKVGSLGIKKLTVGNWKRTRIKDQLDLELGPMVKLVWSVQMRLKQVSTLKNFSYAMTYFQVQVFLITTKLILFFQHYINCVPFELFYTRIISSFACW